MRIGERYKREPADRQTDREQRKTNERIERHRESACAENRDSTNTADFYRYIMHKLETAAGDGGS